jgi:hypothetical protein
MTDDLVGWLGSNKGKSRSKYINHRLSVNEEFIGIYDGARATTNNYSKTVNYIFRTDKGQELIFDSRNPKILETFKSIPFGSKVSIRKLLREGRHIYSVSPIQLLDASSLDI